MRAAAMLPVILLFSSPAARADAIVFTGTQTPADTTYPAFPFSLEIDAPSAIIASGALDLFRAGCNGQDGCGFMSGPWDQVSIIGQLDPAWGFTSISLTFLSGQVSDASVTYRGGVDGGNASVDLDLGLNTGSTATDLEAGPCDPCAIAGSWAVTDPPAPVPEPPTWALLPWMLAAAAMVGVARRRW